MESAGIATQSSYILHEREEKKKKKKNKNKKKNIKNATFSCLHSADRT